MILPNAIIVDVSHWQEPSSIDWKTAREQGNVVGAIVKLMQGGHVDPAAAQHLANAQAAGITLLGVYDFGTSIADDVAFVQAALDKLQGNLSTRLLVLDSEQNNSSQMTVPVMEKWVQGVAGQGRLPVLYMGRAGPDGTGEGLPSAILSKCDLWLPKYGPEPDNSKLPAGFRLPVNDTETGGVCRLWQFTGDGINAPDNWPAGIPPKNDLSYALFSTMDALTAWWTGGVSAPVAAPTPAPPEPTPPPPAIPASTEDDPDLAHLQAELAAMGARLTQLAEAIKKYYTEQ